MLKYTKNDRISRDLTGYPGNDEYIDEQIRKIGKRIFAKYYYDFKTLDPAVYMCIEEDISEASKIRRTRCAIALIKNGFSCEALRRIAASDKVDRETAALAESILTYESHN